jgi:hypothetical protein
MSNHNFATRIQTRIKNNELIQSNPLLRIDLFPQLAPYSVIFIDEDTFEKVFKWMDVFPKGIQLITQIIDQGFDFNFTGSRYLLVPFEGENEPMVISKIISPIGDKEIFMLFIEHHDAVLNFNDK